MRPLLACLIPLALASLAHAAQPGDELLVNGGFEAPTANGTQPASWDWGAGARWEADGGNHWIVEECAAPGSVSVGQRVPIGPGYWKLRLSCRVKAIGVKQGQESWYDARIAMQFQDEQGGMVGAWPEVLHFSGTMADWEEHRRDYLVPAGAAALSLTCSMFTTTGRVEWDDLSLKLLKYRPAPEDATLPEGVVARWDLESAYREETPTRGRVCINGLWRFHPMPLTETALPAAGTGWGYLKVPGTWAPSVSRQRALGPDIWEETLDLTKTDAAWYQREVTVPSEWAGRRILLNIDNPKQSAKVLVDGSLAGRIEWPGGRLDLTALVTPGRTHLLSVYTLALPLEEEKLLVMGPEVIEKARAEVRFKGLCGDCWLEGEPTGARVTDVFVKPSVTNRALGLQCDLSDLQPDRQYRLRARVMEQGKLVRGFAGPVFAGTALASLEGSWADPKLWDIDQPNLYTLAVTLEDATGAALDTTTPLTFGFREFRIEGNDFLLNGKRVHFRCLDYSNAGTDFGVAAYAQARRTFSQARKLGFNYVIHSNYDYEPQSFAYMADTLRAGDEAGFPMSYSIRHISSIFRNFDDPEKRREWDRVVDYEVRQVRNHPSVLMWAMNHNFTGWADDQNPGQLDGRFQPSGADNPWLGEVRRAATKAEGFVMGLDGTRPCYHHQSGSFNQMTTLNCYLCWTPLQERMEWLSRWRNEGVKPLFFVEFGLPHQASWGNHREGPFIWTNNVNSEPLPVEFGAIYNGDEAYRLTDYDLANYAQAERVYADGRPFHLSQVLGDYWEQRREHNFLEIKSLFTRKTWPAFRTYGISAILPWDQADLFKPTPGARGDVVSLPTDWDRLQGPGLAPDFLTWSDDWLTCPEPEGHLEPTSLGTAFLRVNRETLAYLAGEPTRFTSQKHLFGGGETVTKQVVVINDLREEAAVEYSCTATVGGRKVASASGRGQAAPGSKLVVPFRFRAPECAEDTPGLIEVTAKVNGESGDALRDEFPITIVAPIPPVRLPAAASIACYDPRGLTSAALKRFGVPFRPASGPVTPPGCSLFIVGRQAMTLDGPGVDIEGMTARGVTVLVFEQDEDVLQQRWGFRTASPGTRRVFIRQPGHPLCTGLTDELLRDWRGSSTLVEAYPKREGYFGSYPRQAWCGFDNSRTWQWGNQGCVASVVIEKPQRGNWSLPLDCEFDLQYAPLAEWLTPGGRAVFCQLDLTGRDAWDPVADRLMARLISYAASLPSTNLAPASYVGDEATRSELADLGVDLSGGATAIIGPGADPTAARAVAEEAATVICLRLPGDQLSQALPFEVATDGEGVLYTPIGRPVEGALVGLGDSDFHWRGNVALPVITAAPAGVKVLGTGVFAEGTVEGKRYVLVQFVPSDFPHREKPYLKLSHRRAVLALARILTNCGVSIKAPVGERLTAPPPLALDLSGLWQFRTDPEQRLDAAGLTAEAAGANDWRTISVPGTWEEQLPDLKDYTNVAWYRKEFAAPGPLPDASLMLRLGAIDDEDWTYLNGRLVGHIGQDTNPEDYWSAPREYPLSPGDLRPGANVLVVRVNDLRQSAGIVKGPVGIFEPGRWLNAHYLDEPTDLDDPYRYNRW